MAYIRKIFKKIENKTQIMVHCERFMFLTSLNGKKTSIMYFHWNNMGNFYRDLRMRKIGILKNDLKIIYPRQRLD